jgi:hypothetical protein
MRRRTIRRRRAGIVEPLSRCETAPRPRALRLLLGVRLLWGTALLVAPEAVLNHLPHQRIDRPVRTFARLLGTRHLVQAAITTRYPTPRSIQTGAAIDATHAATMAMLAAIRPDRRDLALTNAATATALAGAGLANARAFVGVRSRKPEPERVRPPR